MENQSENEIKIGDRVSPQFLIDIEWDKEYEEWYFPERKSGTLIEIKKEGGWRTYVTKLDDNTLIESTIVKKISK